MASTKSDSFFKDLLQRKYVQHVQGQVTKLFRQPIWINIYTMTQVKQKWIYIYINNGSEKFLKKK